MTQPVDPNENVVHASYVTVWNNLIRVETLAVANRTTREVSRMPETNPPEYLKPEPIITDRYVVINGRTFNVEIDDENKCLVTTARRKKE